MWLGNHPGPDLCNTTPVLDGVQVDLLPDAKAIAAWAREAGIRSSTGRRSRAQSDQVTQFVHRLRAALRAALEDTELTPDLVTGINEALAGTAGVLAVEPAAADPIALRATGDSAQLCLDIGRAVIDIFRYDRGRVRRCASPECVLLFLDVSKSGRRRWCDMGTCGNRAKVSAHYARQRH
jgi:predicted RNA-binding Zn ribbon-like protein